jgi:hypothetical protein
VPVRVSPTDRIHRHIDDLFSADRPLPEILEEVARLGAQLLMQAALEAEVTEFLVTRQRDGTSGSPRPRDHLAGLREHHGVAGAVSSTGGGALAVGRWRRR